MIANLAADVGTFTSNVFHVAGERPAVVDVGANFDVVSKLRARGAPEAVVLTHAHPDHVGNLAEVADAFDVEVLGFDADREGVDRPIADGDRLRLGDHEYLAVHTPGHEPTHLCLYADEPGVLFAGDLLFANGGFGRTDLPGADHAALVESVDRVLELVDDNLAAMHAGHGPSVERDPYRHVEMAAQAARTAADER